MKPSSTENRITYEEHQQQKTAGQEESRQSNPLRCLTPGNISAGVISGTLAMTGPPMIILEAAARGNFTQEQTIGWMFAVYVFGGLFSILMPLWLRIPVTWAHSISGVAFLVTVTSQFSYPQLIGGYVMSGLLILFVGITGIFSRIIQWVPKEIIAAMLAGLVTSYVVRLVTAIQEMPVVGLASLLSFFALTKWAKRIPAVIGAVAVGFATLFLTHDLGVSTAQSGFVLPAVHQPEFSLLGFFTLAVPLSLLILSNDAAPGIGALETCQFKPPITRIITISGLSSIAAGLFGGQSANIAGMMTSICADEEAGEKQKRYMASVISGVLILFFGVFAWWLVPFIQALPSVFVTMLAGLALIGVLGTSLQAGFGSSRHRLGAIFAFAIALSNVSFLHVSAPVWALIAGALVAKGVEGEK